MADNDKSSKTEKPTFKRLTKAYEKGSVARSVDFSHAVSLAVFLLWGSFAGTAFMAGMFAVVRDGIRRTAEPFDETRLATVGLSALIESLKLLLPLLLSLMTFSIVGTHLQGGIHVRKPWIKFELAKLNPINGLKGLFSLDKVISALKAVMRTSVYALIALLVVFPEWRSITAMALLKPTTILSEAMGIAGRVLSRALLVGIVIGVADYAVARYRWYRNLYMTKQEIKDEHKEMENPEIKGRIRGKQREMARKRMMADLRTANVVVTNPTHVAVALRYDRLSMSAPVVVAKGKGFIALRIREEAARWRIPLVEDPPLARMLEKLCDVGAPIPEALYRAVAEVFAYVFRQRRGLFRQHPEVEAEHAAAKAAADAARTADHVAAGSAR